MAVSHCIHEFLKGDDQKAIPFFVPKYWTQHRIPFPRTSPVIPSPVDGSLSLRDSFLSSRACRGISPQLLPALGEVATGRRGHPLRKLGTRSAFPSNLPRHPEPAEESLFNSSPP